GGRGRTYLCDGSRDLPRGDGLDGGDAVFYVGNLVGDFTGDGVVSDPDVAGFLDAFNGGDSQADFRGDGFAATAPDGQVTPRDLDGFITFYQAAVEEGRRLDALPDPGPQGVGSPGPLAGESAPVPVALGPAATPAADAGMRLSVGAPEPVLVATAVSSTAEVDILAQAPVVSVGVPPAAAAPADGGLSDAAPLAYASETPITAADPVLQDEGGMDLLALPEMGAPLGIPAGRG
ncbi:MAG: hypothetical protein NTU94_15300, partial [Planctomycetota bacterium]|nr:hypothetical protein [Planctomycetota bacterium]